ncbi:TolC family protein [Thioalkalivibrio sp. ALJT]|uniref:TolC family protein n=1 Tax=Thioalkalivibrio sp. ALJT TaxID=1158146 RepID=UPI001E5BD55A|nr:TolC family protein [Thioalkalivibrio sp. ALJT]
MHPHNAQFEVDTRSRIRAPGDWRQALEDKDWAEEHPSVVAQIEAVEARRAELERHRRSFRPTLQAGANYRVDRFAEGGTAPNYTVGVELRWDIFDGGDRGSRVAEARAQQMSAAAAREHRYNEVVTQAREAENDLAEAEERIQLAQRALAASEEDLRNARGGYREGVRSFSDLSQAQVDVAEAQARLEGARFDRQKALARLYWALGSIPTDTLR